MIERKIIIGLITSTEFLQGIQSSWNPQLLASTTAKRLAGWVWEYFIKYHKAPGRDIEVIYFSKLKENKLSKDMAEEIEQDILPGLSEEYEREGVDVKPLLDEVRKYFNERHLQIFSDGIQALLSTGKVVEAETLAREYKPIAGSSVELSDFIVSVAQIRRRDRPKPTLLMSPWLREGQITILYGNYGSGKSLLTILIAYLLGIEDPDRKECDIGEWQVKHSTGTLYIDGELGEVEMEERVKQYEWLGKQQGDYRMKILSVPEYQFATEDTFYLSSRENQLKIVNWLKDHPHYKLVVLDSASTLFGLDDENSNSEWNNKINPLLRDLRGLGVACLLLHHAGKDGKKGFRGASAIGAMAQGIYRLANHEKKNIDAGEAWFVLSKDKQRGGGFSFGTFSMKFTQNNDQTETEWEITKF